MTRPLVYIAAPLFNEGERNLNLRIRDRLLPHSDVYLPQLDGTLLVEAVAGGESYGGAAERIFRDDTSAIARCDALLIVLNGRVVDEGAAFELGIAWAMGKACAGFKADPRQLLRAGDNPMIDQALDAVLRDLDEVASWAASLSSGKKPVDRRHAGRKQD